MRLGTSFADHDGNIGDERLFTTTIAVAIDPAGFIVHPPTPAGAPGTARAASPTIPFRMPMDVMPIWMVDKNRVGASSSPPLARRHRRRLRVGQPRPRRRNERDLGHGEQAVEKDQGDKEYVHGLLVEVRIGGALRRLLE